MMCMSSVSAGDTDNLNFHDVSKSNMTNIYGYGGFDELNSDIQNLEPGDIYDIQKDYTYNEKHNTCYEKGILINTDNITINGNNHVIDGGGLSALFTINGNNVKIFNLTFTNSKDTFITTYFDYKYVDSPITWNGNNGTISGSEFIGNSAVNGGAITWTGDNGNIYDCKFMNNSASCIGGALYVSGANNTVSNSIFLDSNSRLSCEAIYYEPKCKNHNINSCSFDGLNYVNGIMGGDYFFLWNATTDVAGQNVDIYQYLYLSIFYNQTVTFNNIICYSMWNGTDFILYFNKIFDNQDEWIQIDPTYSDCHSSIIFTKSLNITTDGNLNSVYSYLFYNLYKEEYTLTANYRISGPNAYQEAMKKNSDYVFGKFLKYIGNSPVNKILNIELKNQKGQSVKCKNKWKVASLGYDIVSIDGNGLKVCGQYEDRHEDRWAFVEDCQLTVSNMIIEGFNVGIENKGTCILNNVVFNKNKMIYILDSGYGGGILNYGLCICNNCSFTHNRADFGGAICNIGILVVNTCTFDDNRGYEKGNNILNINDAVVMINGYRYDSGKNDKIISNPFGNESCYNASDAKLVTNSKMDKKSNVGFFVSLTLIIVGTLVMIAVPVVSSIICAVTTVAAGSIFLTLSSIEGYIFFFSGAAFVGTLLTVDLLTDTTVMIN